MPVGAATLARAAAAPERLAVRDDAGDVSFGALADEVVAVRDAVAASTAPGALVPADGARPAATLARLLGIALAGRVAVVGPAAGAAGLPTALAPAAGGVDAQPFLAAATSGTSGRPAAFARSHASWLASFRGCDAVFGMGPDDVVLAPGPLAHTLVLFAAVDALERGAAVVARGAFDPRRAAADLADGATRLVAVPTALADLAAARPPAPALRTVIAGGAKLAPALADAIAATWPAAALHEYYGASELSFVSVRRHGDGAPPTSVGRAFPGVEVRVADGEVQVRSPLVFAGYLAGDGAARLLADGWATVGDRGRLDADGTLHVLGRTGDMLVVGGVNVYPGPIEDALAAHPEVAEAAVVGLPDARWGEVPVAAIVPAPGARPSAAALRAHAAALLDRHQRPRRFVLVDALPRTAAGKLARAAVRDRLAADA